MPGQNWLETFGAEQSMLRFFSTLAALLILKTAMELLLASSLLNALAASESPPTTA